MRELGTFEWLMRLLRMNVVGIAEVRGELRETTVREALRAVQNRHPLLRVATAGTRFVARDGEIPLRTTVGDVDAVVEEELRTPFALDAAPLARCAIVRHADARSTIVLTVCHAIIDGRSATFLMRDLLHAAGGGTLAPLDPPRAAESHLFASMSRLEMVKRFFRESMRNMRQARALKKVGGTKIERGAAQTPDRYDSGVLLATQDAEWTSRLIERAHAEQTSVHAALCAAQLRALAAEYSDGQPFALHLTSPVNLVGRVDAPVDEDLLFFASGVEAPQVVDTSVPFWDHARAVRQQLGAREDAGRLFIDNMIVPQILRPLRRWFPPDDTGFRRLLSFVDQMPISLTVVTNLGVLAMPAQYGPLSMESLTFVTSNPTTPFLSSATTWRGRLQWNFVFHPRVMAREKASAVAARAMRLLEVAAQ